LGADQEAGDGEQVESSHVTLVRDQFERLTG
jgi:hypothetical protein